MSYTIREGVSPKEWEIFLSKQDSALFVQSALSGEVHKKTGEDFWIIGVYQDDILVGGSLVLSVHAKRGSFLLLPYGPVIDYHNKDVGLAFMTYMKVFGKKYGYDFIRFSPYVEYTDVVYKTLKTWGAKKAPMHVLAENTWLLDTKKTETTLLADMKKNHRNLIRRCEKQGVTIQQTTSAAALARLNDMHDVVAKRHNFHRFSRSFVDSEFTVFSKEGKACIFEGYLPDGKLDSSAIIIFYNGMACYRHSASLNQDKRLPTSYLLQWEVIKEVKKRGIQWYNFWGIAPKGSPKSHPFSGISHFKQGFGGVQKDLIPCMDVPLTKKYYINWIVETIRRVRRGF